MTEPLPRSRGTVLAQVLVAAVFLAVIGGSVGLALGLRDRDQSADRSQGNNRVPGSGVTDDRSSGPPAGESPSTGRSPVFCREEIERRAGRGDLGQVLYIQTEQSEVWICRDGQGAAYYYGHRFSPDGRLFLTDVRRQGDEYLATNASVDGTTVYRVSRDELVIDNGDGEPEVQRVVSTSG